MGNDGDELDVYLILFSRGNFLFFWFKANNGLNVQQEDENTFGRN